MNPSTLKRIAGALLLVAVLGAGCSRSASAPPEPISLEQLAPALDQAFAKAKPEVKDLAAAVTAALKAQDYSNASIALQTLCGKSGLSKEQGTLLARGMLSVNSALQSAQAQGDKKAADTLRWQRANK